MMTIGLAFRSIGRSHQSVQSIRSALLLTPGSSFLPYNFAISPDGQRLSFVALGSDGKLALWVRGLASSGAQPLTGTDGASFPFWAPDSLHVGFFAQGQLKTIDLLNSTVQIVCDAVPGFGGSWNSQGTIVFAPGVTGPIFKVSASGGIPQVATKVEPGSSESHHWPYFLPNGKHFLFYINWRNQDRSEKNGIYVASLYDDNPKLVSTEISGNVSYVSGNLIYVRNSTLMAQPFDLGKQELTGSAVPLTRQELDEFFDFWQAGYSVSENGLLVFQSTADSPKQLTWIDSSGKELGQFSQLGFEGPRFSPDGRFIAVYSDDERNGKHYIRVYDLVRNLGTRLTEGGNESMPVWSRDGRTITFRDSALDIEEMPADGSAPPLIIIRGTNVIPCDRSPGDHLVYMSLDNGEPFPNLEVYSPAEHKSVRFGRFGAEPQFSPDGKWIAYIELPSREIFVQPIPGPSARVQISNNPGSSQPRWSHDGRKIYYIQPDRKLMSVPFDPERHSVGAPELVAQTRIAVTMFGGFQYDVTADGRFLVNSLPTDNSAPLTLMTGWDTMLRH